jgi:hypothetical protein
MFRNLVKRACFSTAYLLTMICRTAVPTVEAHRLPQKVRVFIGATA